MDVVKVVKGDNQTSEGRNHAPTTTPALAQDCNSQSNTNQDVPDYNLNLPIDFDSPSSPSDSFVSGIANLFIDDESVEYVIENVSDDITDVHQNVPTISRSVPITSPEECNKLVTEECNKVATEVINTNVDT